MPLSPAMNVICSISANPFPGVAQRYVSVAEQSYIAENENLIEYNTNNYTAILTGMIVKFKPNIVIFPATHLGRDLAPRVAASLKVGLTADCTGLSIKDGLLLQTRPAFGGNIMADIITPSTRPQMATVRPNVMKISSPDSSKKANIISVPVEIDPKAMRIIIKKSLKRQKQVPRA